MLDNSSNAKGILWAIVAVGLFSFIYISGKLSDYAADPVQIIWLRYLGGFFFIMAIVISAKAPDQLRTPQMRIHFLRAACGGGGGIAAIYAAMHMPVADATAIGLLDGFFTVLLGAFLLKEVLTRTQWLAAYLCLVGALVVVLGNGATLSIGADFWLPASIALAGASLVAVESILIKTLARSEQTITVLFYVNLFGVLLFAPPAFYAWRSLDGLSFFGFIALGPIAIFAQFCNINAFRHSDAAIIGPVRYTWLLFGAGFGYFLFSETPTLLTLVGGSLIVLGGATLARSRRLPTTDRVAFGNQQRKNCYVPQLTVTPTCLDPGAVGSMLPSAPIELEGDVGERIRAIRYHRMRYLLARLQCIRNHRAFRSLF